MKVLRSMSLLDDGTDGWKQPQNHAGVGQSGTLQGFQPLRFSEPLKTDRHRGGVVAVDDSGMGIAYLRQAGSGQTAVGDSPDALFRMTESKMGFPNHAGPVYLTHLWRLFERQFCLSHILLAGGFPGSPTGPFSSQQHERLKYP